MTSTTGVKGVVMPVVTVYRHGATAGIGSVGNRRPPKREEVKGWSLGSVRRNLAFLRSVDERGLTGEGWALTLTVRDCPPTHTDWHKTVELYLLQVKRLIGTVRSHWVTEWQRRGVPHLHGAIWFPPGTSERYAIVNMLIKLWVGYAAAFGVGEKGQMVKPIDGVIGWFQYISKHAARGVKHYQRASENIPQGWIKTGRMWSKAGDWPIKEPVKLTLDSHGYHVLRRWARSWRKADARAAHAKVYRSLVEGRLKSPVVWRESISRIKDARTMLRCPDPKLSGVRGISEWISEDLILRMMERLSLDGYSVES